MLEIPAILSETSPSSSNGCAEQLFFFQMVTILGMYNFELNKKGAAELMLGIHFLSLLWIEVNYSGSCRQSPHLRNFDSLHALFVHSIHILKFSIRVMLIYSVPACLLRGKGDLFWESFSTLQEMSQITILTFSHKKKITFFEWWSLSENVSEIKSPLNFNLCSFSLIYLFTQIF